MNKTEAALVCLTIIFSSFTVIQGRKKFGSRTTRKSYRKNWKKRVKRHQRLPKRPSRKKNLIQPYKNQWKKPYQNGAQNSANINGGLYSIKNKSSW